MYGLPSGLTYDLYVQLTLNYQRAHARKARSTVIANDLAAGRTAPLEYYLLDQSDETEGLRAFEEARCRAALNRSKKV